jgi:hypothetical protein
MSEDYNDNLGGMDSGNISLGSLDGAFAAAKPDTGTDVPDGEYIVEVTKVQLSETKDKIPMVKWELTILEPSHVQGIKAKGRKLFRNDMLAAKPKTNSAADIAAARELTDKRIGWFKGALKLAGLRDMESGETAGQYIGGYVIPSLKNEVLRVKKKTNKGEKGDFSNVYISARLGNTADGSYMVPEDMDGPDYSNQE